ncbi:MAG TPA: bifunctional hydroxymethylpyrimidine kinase/phosphomethylpyrimidine kinase [Caulobacteraceae bacterium]|nr:bifunctional hydroxymethylpyrimidine kinase/phosphomethylpyrimidine kinase [Caulobacteraceae bacterium]
MSGRRGRVLAVGGSDNVGGAGIQADVKTVTILGGYAMTAITAVTVQDTTSVRRIRSLPGSLIEAQGRAAIADIGVDAIKTGMLPTVAAVRAAAALADLAPQAKLVVDPVLVSSSGAKLFADSSARALFRSLLPRADLFTPNAREAARIVGFDIDSTDDLRRAAETLLKRGPKAVLVKGGHVPGEMVTDLLVTGEGHWTFRRSRIATRHTRGTGCTLASACAAGLALGLSVLEAVENATLYVAEAIRRAPGYGAGNGPLDHGWPANPGAIRSPRA